MSFDSFLIYSMNFLKSIFSFSNSSSGSSSDSSFILNPSMYGKIPALNASINLYLLLYNSVVAFMVSSFSFLFSGFIRLYLFLIFSVTHPFRIAYFLHLHINPCHCKYLRHDLVRF